MVRVLCRYVASLNTLVVITQQSTGDYKNMKIEIKKEHWKALAIWMVCIAVAGFVVANNTINTLTEEVNECLSYLQERQPELQEKYQPWLLDLENFTLGDLE